jgi:signal transduction histidine kinase
MRFAPGSVRARLTLWYTLVLSIPLAAFAVASYAVFANALHNRTDAFIGDALAAFGQEAGAERRIYPRLADAIRVTLEEVRFQELDIFVADGTGALLGMSDRHEAGTVRSPSDSARLHTFARDALRAGRVREATVDLSSGPHRLLARQQTIGGQFAIVGGAYPLGDVETMLSRIRRMFWIAIPLLIAVAASGGWVLAGRSLEPVERAFEQQRRFMADASHELRTPSAVLRAEADITLSRPTRSEAEYRASMTVVQDAARRLSRIVDDIFLLARADAGHLVMRTAPVHLDDVVVDSVRAVQSIATSRGITIALRNPVEAPVHGDADLLGRVLLNLLDNAVKHSSSGSSVDVLMTKSASGVAVSVVDSGPGIPEGSQERVFERFFRVDTARARSETTATSGAGLGLPIARRIAEMHGGRLDLVESRPGRTEFRLSLPAPVGGGA